MADEPVTTVETEKPELPDTPPASDPPADAPPPEPAKDAGAAEHERIEGMSRTLNKLSQAVSGLVKQAEKQNGELTKVQEAKRQEAADEIARIQQELAGMAAGPDDELGTKLAKIVTAQAQELATLRTEVKTIRQHKPQAQGSPDQQWAALQATYPGADVKGLWKEAVKSADNSPSVKDAESRLQSGDITPEAFEQVRAAVANDLFHHEARRAKAQRPPTARPAPQNPPGGKRSVPFGGGSQPAPAEPDPYLDTVMQASREMDEG